MKYLLNFYNQAGAGANILVKTFINSLYETKEHDDEFIIILPKISFFTQLKFEQRSDVCIYYLPFLNGIGKILFRYFFDLIAFPLLTLLLRPNSVLVFGNYAPVPFLVKKIILCHHPHLIDDDLLLIYDLKIRIMEKLKRFWFFLTVRSSNRIVVESAYMRNKLIEKYNISEQIICVIKNSISHSLYNSRSTVISNVSHEERKKSILYISRFEPHKNHAFLLDLVAKSHKKLEAMETKFYITVDASRSRRAYEFIEEIKAQHLEHIIINLGELSHEELASYYEKSLCLFFPSRSETFGIPLIESMAFKLPIIIADLPYAHSMCGEAALYYSPDSIDSAFDQISDVYNNETIWITYSEKSQQQFMKYPAPKEWVKKYLDLLR